MERVILVVGLPGSGKTHYAKTLGGVLVDDPRDFSEIEKVSTAPLVVITDPHLCLLSNQKAAKEKFSSIRQLQWVFFENDPKQCLENAKTRERGKSQVIFRF